MTKRTERASFRGGLYGLLAAALFGLSAPIAKRLLGEMTPQLLAGLLYCGAGLGLSAWQAVRGAPREAALQRRDLPALAVVVVAGGIAGPLLLLVGLARVSGVVGSLLLNLEGPLTMLLALLLFDEHLGRHGAAAAALILAGAALLKLDPAPGSADAVGMLAVGAACLCWALDNNLTQRLSLRDPFAIVRIKTLAAGSFNLGLGLLLGGHLPGWRVCAAAMLLGLASYGGSVVLDAYALRLVGAAREAAYFATAPFVGALLSTLLLGDSLRTADFIAMLAMALGVAALLLERHSHWHEHEPLEHEHTHVHDEHHQHSHPPGTVPDEPHSHPHRHAAIAHEHPHLPDAHHRHRH